jgi:uncharacterized protein YbjT (DUF2867 family)
MVPGGDEPRTFAVFGGTGFLGQRIVRHIAARNGTVRVISRHPERGAAVFRDEALNLEFVGADANDDSSVRTALAGAFGVVNAVSLYIEGRSHTFHSVHVDAASRLARHSRECGVARLIHVSGVGADRRSRSRYIRARGEGEDAVRSAFPGVTIVRPTVMFGAGDAFLTPLVRLLRQSPVIPIFGSGRTLLQPAHVEDVGKAISLAFDQPEAVEFYEFGGPRILSYADLLRSIGDYIGVRRVLLPIPFSVWQTLAFGMEMLPHPLLTRNQVELMMIDNIASVALPGFKDLEIEPDGIETGLANIEERDRRQSGRF